MTVTPEMARAILQARRSGQIQPGVAAPAAPAAPQRPSQPDPYWQAQIGLESRGRQFNAQGQPLTSPAGAVGVAQVMPTTGPEAAQLAGLPWDEQRFAHDPEYNMAIGRAYREQQMKEFGDPVLAAAAYNAGPGAVRKWLQQYGDPTKGDISLENWVARIPYAETRNYAQKVMEAGGPRKPKVTPEMARQILEARRRQAAPIPEPVERQPEPEAPFGLTGGPGRVASAVRDFLTPETGPEAERARQQAYLEPGMRHATNREVLWPFIKEEGAQTAGGLAGAALGFGLGGFPGAVVGAGIGGGLAGGVDDAVKQVLADPSVPLNYKQTLQAAIQSGSEEALTEAIGRGAELGIRGLMNLRTKALPESVAADKFLKTAGGEGLSVARMGEGWGAKFAESVAHGAPIGGGRMSANIKSNTEALETFASDWLDRVAGEGVSKMSRAEIGNMVLDVVDEGRKAMSVIDAELYKRVDDLMPNTVTQRVVKKPMMVGKGEAAKPLLDAKGQPLMVDAVEEVVTGPVNTKSIKEWATGHKAEYEQVKTGASADINNLLDDILNMPDDAPLERVALLRSRVGELNRALQRQAGTSGTRYLMSAAESQITRAIEAAAEKLGPEASQALKAANTFHRQSKAKLLDDFMVKLLRKEETPSAIAEAITQPEHFKKVRNALMRASNLSKRAPAPGARRAANMDFAGASPREVRPVEFKETWDRVRGSWLAQQLNSEKGIDKMGLITKLKSKKGQEMLRAATTGTEYGELKQLANAIERVGTSQKASNNMIAWRQMGAILQFGSGGAAATGVAMGAGLIPLGAGGAVLVGPLAVAHLMTSSAGRKLLTRMTKTPMTSSAAPGLMLRLEELLKESLPQEGDQPVNPAVFGPQQ